MHVAQRPTVVVLRAKTKKEFRAAGPNLFTSKDRLNGPGGGGASTGFTLACAGRHRSPVVSVVTKVKTVTTGGEPHAEQGKEDFSRNLAGSAAWFLPVRGPVGWRPLV